MTTFFFFEPNLSPAFSLFLTKLLEACDYLRSGRGPLGELRYREFSRVYFSMLIIIADAMQSKQNVEKQTESPQRHSPSITELIWQRRNRLLHALEPQLTDIARKLLRKEYRKVLPKILEARSIYKQKFKELQGGGSSKEAGKTWQGFRRCLQQKLHQIISGMLNELADRLAVRFEAINSDNLIAQAIKIYSSVTGSYQQKLTLLQKLSPNVRTLSYIQSEMVQHSGDRELSGSIWVLLYIFSFAFVQMFGKYITRIEREEAIRIIRGTFIRNIAVVAGGIERQDASTKKMSPNKLSDAVDEWIQELSKQTGVLPSL